MPTSTRTLLTVPARKVQCDGAVPNCGKCRLSQRECQGYEVRLSWPKNHDKKRAMVLELVSEKPFLVPSHVFLNTTWTDVAMHVNGDNSLPAAQDSAGDSAITFLPDESASNLLRHFHDAAYLSLVTFTATRLAVRDVLERLMKTSSGDAAGQGLLAATLAFSSLHRQGLSQQAIQTKIRALNLLSVTTDGSAIHWTQAARHVAASMLLASFEILHPLNSSADWLWYVRGAMATAAFLANHLDESDVEILLDWVNYHYMISQFPLQRFRKVPAGQNHHLQTYTSPLSNIQITMPSPNPTQAILNLLCNASSLNSPSENLDIQLTTFKLSTLEQEAGHLSILNPSERNAEIAYGAKIWHLATRLYLTRASQSAWEAPADLSSEIEEGYARIAGFYECRHFFPLFVLACEARTDEKRSAIEGLIERTEKSNRGRSMQGLKDIIHSIWVQQDLYADEDVVVDYLGVIRAVFGSGSLSLA
ncbi:fungal-specific transcription factor domain-containing protein [Stachybotrys elegans]|uniref:Fungal-specific transcription factor domain-containing protein n=1 Tax=Stachybotrys elegans TaxID=80388 RepID=A0A8K0SKS3_9HYPO|nr:fungal-specific transcription factor domain-containing protein [Stachybotrys elegans]